MSSRTAPAPDIELIHSKYLFIRIGSPKTKIKIKTKPKTLTSTALVRKTVKILDSEDSGSAPVLYLRDMPPLESGSNTDTDPEGKDEDYEDWCDGKIDTPPEERKDTPHQSDDNM